MRTRSHTNSPWNAPSPFTVKFDCLLCTQNQRIRQHWQICLHKRFMYYHTNSLWNAPSPFTTDQLENSINNRPILLNVRNFEKGGVSKVTSGMDGHFWFRSHDVRAAAVASGDRSQFLPSPANSFPRFSVFLLLSYRIFQHISKFLSTWGLCTGFIFLCCWTWFACSFVFISAHFCLFMIISDQHQHG
jgi:hypothetical protein